jgi:hypothetical protein
LILSPIEHFEITSPVVSKKMLICPHLRHIETSERCKLHRSDVSARSGSTAV